MTTHPTSTSHATNAPPPLRVLRGPPQELSVVERRALRLWKLRRDTRWEDAVATVPSGPVPHRVTQLSGEQDYAIAECTCVEGYQRLGARWGKVGNLSRDDAVQHRAWALLAYLRATRAVSAGAAWDAAAAHAVASVAADQEDAFTPVEWLLSYQRGQAESP